MTANMVAVGYAASLPIGQERSLFEFETAVPQARGRDLLVRVRAVSVNPVDTKVRMRKQGTPAEPVILGWDAAGVVEAVGADCRLFKPGDEVFYAGNINRPGTNAPFHLVDERIVGHKPKSLGFIEAAALPLTSITAWEALFARLQVPVGKSGPGRSVLIVGAAGGVGSIATQLARRLTPLTVIGTASRPQTREWVMKAGAHLVIDHSKPLSEELQRAGHPEVDYIFAVTASDKHWPQLAAAVKPQGRICMIDDPATLDVKLLKGKSAGLIWESMFTRSVFQTADMQAQHDLLEEVAALVDEGLIRTTLSGTFGRLGAADLKRAHAQIESGTTIGKIVLEVP